MSSRTEQGAPVVKFRSHRSYREVTAGPSTHWAKFVFVIFFCVCGGAFGYEEAVGKAGPALTLLMTLIIPLVWCVPLAYVTAELGTMYPESNEGVFVWIRHGFGRRFGPVLSFCAAIVYYITYVVDLALYATLFFSYFQYLAEDVFTGPLSYYLVIVGLIVVVAGITLVGVDLIGSIATVVAILVLSPFLVTLQQHLKVWGGVAGYIQPQRDWIAPPPGPNGTWTWSNASTPEGLAAINSGFHVCIWSLSGYDALGNVVMQLRDPGRTFGRALICAIMLSFLTYSTAVIGLLGAPTTAGSHIPNFSYWKAGFFSKAAETLGGPALRIVVVVAALLSCYATLQALMMPVSEQLVELCAPALLDIPFFRWKLPRVHTPFIAIMFNAAITFLFSFVDFEDLVDMLNLLHATVLLLVLIAFVSLRYRPEGRMMLRPFSAVSRSWMAPLLVFFPFAIASWLVIGIVWLKSFWTGVGAVAIYALGVPLFFGCRERKKRGWLYATMAPPPDKLKTETDALINRE